MPRKRILSDGTDLHATMLHAAMPTQIFPLGILRFDHKDLSSLDLSYMYLLP